CMSLPDCDLCHSIPGELDELVERGFKQPLDVAMRTEIDLVLCTRRGADSIALDSLRPQLGHVTRTCGHAGEYRRTRVHLSTYFLQGTVHLGVEARGGRWGSGSGHWHDSDRRIGNHASYFLMELADVLVRQGADVDHGLCLRGDDVRTYSGFEHCRHDGSP